MLLTDLAKIIRSKNAGPLYLTIDLMFIEHAAFTRARASEKLRPRAIAELYGVRAEAVEVIPFEAALAIKIVLERPVIAGSPGDRDVYGAQQHRLLLDLDL